MFGVFIRGATGTWAGLNGFWTATAITNTTFSVPFNGNGLGSLTGNVTYNFDFMPYGATIRLKSTFDVSSLCTPDGQDKCAAAQIILNTLQRYGLILADGTIPSDNWDNGVVESEYHDDRLTDAAAALAGCTGSTYYTCPSGWTNFGAIDQYLEVVDRSSQIGPKGGIQSNLAWWQQTTARTYVSVTGSQGSASQDVIPLGTVVGTDRERVTIPGGSSYQTTVWVNGNLNTGVNYSISGITGASVSTSGLVTMPSCGTTEEGTLTVTSAAESAALPLLIDVWCIPVSPDSGIRMAFGNFTGNYFDTYGFWWWGATNLSGYYHGFSNWYQVVGDWLGTQSGTWQGIQQCSNDTWQTTGNPQLYGRSMSSGSDGADLPLEIDGLTNGTYTVMLNGEPDYGGLSMYYPNQCGNIAGNNVFTYELQGVVPSGEGYLDGYVLAGNQPYVGWTLSNAVTVTDGKLTVVLRNRNQSSIYGVAAGSLLIKPGPPPPGIRTVCSGEHCKITNLVSEP